MDTSYVLTVGDLVQILFELPKDLPVVMSADGEGNSFSPLAGYNERLRYIEDAPGASMGAVASDEDCEEVNCDHVSCTFGTGTPVLVLWPLN